LERCPNANSEGVIGGLIGVDRTVKEI